MFVFFSFLFFSYFLFFSLLFFTFLSFSSFLFFLSFLSFTQIESIAAKEVLYNERNIHSQKAERDEIQSSRPLNKKEKRKKK